MAASVWRNFSCLYMVFVLSYIYGTFNKRCKVAESTNLSGSNFPYYDVGINKRNIMTSKLDLSLTRYSVIFVLDLTCKRS